MFVHAEHRRFDPRQRALAALLALTVLALGLLSVAPSLHAAFHHGPHAAEQTCAVDLFAAGVALAVGAITLRAVALLALGAIVPTTVVRISAPAWQLPPGRGPPQE